MVAAPLGILGGTFDPVHNAHLRIGQLALAVLRLGQVLWIPTGTPAGYRHAPVAPAQDRLAMLRVALADEPRFAIDRRELVPQVSGYTVDTLGALRREHGHETPLVLLMGGDQFAKLDSWHRWQDLFSLAHVAVFARPGWRPETNEAVRAALATREAPVAGAWRKLPAGAIVRVAFPPLDVSATMVRERIACGETVADLLPRAVLDYIDSHQLYRRS